VARAIHDSVAGDLSRSWGRSPRLVRVLRASLLALPLLLVFGLLFGSADPLFVSIFSLPDIDVPTLVVWGENDQPFVKPGRYMAAKIPAARHAVIAGAGHASNLDRPDEFNESVRDFMEHLP